ncbi:MAG: tetratricopeptide repeat protein [Hyphomicrobiaceae bacterium]|nr:tetratricopeptide repeat protein [Hyphomicrobiaceae bacterium]
MLRLVILMLLVLVGGLDAGAAPGDEGMAKAKEAATALQRGQAEQAVLLYAAALTDQTLSNDRRAQLLNDRGVANARLNRLRAAIEDFNQSVQLAPESASAYNNRGNVLLALGLAAEAEKDFNRALTLAPGYAAALVNRGNGRALAGDHEAAARDFARAARLAPKTPAAYGGLARLNLQMNRPHAAIRDLNRAVGSDTRYGPGYRMRAEAHGLIGRFDEAIEDLSRAITFDGGNGELYVSRGYAHLAVRNPAAAIKDFQRGAELLPKSSAAVEGLALAQARGGNFEAALDSLAKALEIEPRSGQAYAYRAIVYKMMGQADLGQRDLERALRLEPTRPEVQWARGELLELTGQREEAVAALREAVAGRPHLREAVQSLERLGGEVAVDAEARELAFDRWRVFTRQGRYYTTNAEYPRLNVPLEMLSAGAPRIVEFEVKGGAQAGVGILRFIAGHGDAKTGAEEVEHAAVLDLQARSILAVETIRQGQRQASWSWEEDKLVVTDIDGFKQEYPFKGPRAREIAEQAAPTDVTQRQAPKPRPRPSDGSSQAWVPWGSDPWRGGGGGSSGRKSQKPKTLFELLFN